LITGGAGFLGRALLRELAQEPAHELCVLDTRPLAAQAGVAAESLVGDIRRYEDVLRACQDVDVVYHSASIVDWGRFPDELLEEVNVTGTLNILRACREAGVSALVYTSTMDVVHDGGAVSDGDETLPYPERFHGAYPRTKAWAEQAVLKAHDTPVARGRRLRTCVLRPCGMFGEGDPYHVRSVLDMLASGLLLARMGDGRARYSFVYVGNAAHAHVLAAHKLARGEAGIGGQVFLITDGPPVNFFEFMAKIAAGVGLELPKRSIPFRVVYPFAWAVELGAALLRPWYPVTPIVTRTSVSLVCKDFCFRSDKAARLLGYTPKYARDEAVLRTIADFREHWRAA
jgi:nucleoside-diphosphate-sugar epimerase